MKFDDKRLDYIEYISLENTRVDHSSPIIFLCGGLVDVKSNQSLSVRSAIITYLHAVNCTTASQIIVAEQFKDWLHDSVYTDLISFEDDLASLSSLIILVLESPGSLTELGLFLRHSEIKNKLLVFVEQEHYTETSFIKLGPIRQLERVNQRSVSSYPWQIDAIDASLKESLKEMHDDILNSLAHIPKTESLRKNNVGHKALLAFQIIKTYRALKFSEIQSYLKLSGINDSKGQIKKMLFLLEKFELTKAVRRGNTLYYIAIKDVRKIDFGGKFDEKKALMSAMQFYITNESETQRLAVIKAAYPPPASISTTDRVEA